MKDNVSMKEPFQIVTIHQSTIQHELPTSCQIINDSNKIKQPQKQKQKITAVVINSKPANIKVDII